MLTVYTQLPEQYHSMYVDNISTDTAVAPFAHSTGALGVFSFAKEVLKLKGLSQNSVNIPSSSPPSVNLYTVNIRTVSDIPFIYEIRTT